MKRMLASLAVVIVLGLVADAQSGLTGKWQGETSSGKSVVLDLTVAKATLSGTLTYDGTPSTISDGQVTKNAFTFKAMLEGQQEGFSGELTGDQIKFWPDRMGADRAIILSRVKPSKK